MAHAFNPNTLEAEVGRSLVSFRSVRVNSWTARTVTKRNSVTKNQIGKKRERGLEFLEKSDHGFQVKYQALDCELKTRSV